MLRIVELDPKAKDHGTTVYVVTVGDEKIGVSEAELLEIVTAKLAKSQAKRAASKTPARAAVTVEAVAADAGDLWSGIAAGE